MRILWFIAVCCVLAGCGKRDLPHASKASKESSVRTLDDALLSKRPDAIKAMETVLQRPEEIPATTLYLSAAVALQQNRLEDSGFLFYAAQMRARFDKECFPPKGSGGDSPLLVYIALSSEIGGSVNPALMREPHAFAKAIDRVRSFSPKAPATYSPGYEFGQRMTEDAAREATCTSRREFLAGMVGISTLLSDAEYFSAFRVVQDYHLEAADKRPSKERRDGALQTMSRIEVERNIKGLAAVSR